MKAYRISPHNKWERWYVSHVPGEEGAGWGWVTKSSQAKDLSVYWQRRFAKDMQRVNTQAYFEEVRTP